MEISQFTDIDCLKEKVLGIRQSYIEDMVNRLCSFESKMLDKKFHVYWASSENNLTDMILNLLPEPFYNRFCFDVPQIPAAFLKTNAIKNIPIIDIENGNQNANFLFTKADFAVVETRTVVLLEKKSKGCFNKIPNIFIILDINKLVNKMSDLETILYVKSYYQSERFLPTDVRLIENPYRQVRTNKLQLDDKEYDLTDTNISIFLYDNGISKIMENNVLRNCLYCIDCGMCAKVCPVFAYPKEYTPIELDKSNCCSNTGNKVRENTLLCGNCDQVCPVQIPFSTLLIKEIENNLHVNSSAASGVAKTFSKRKKLNKMNGSFRRFFFLKKLFGKNKMIYNYFKEQKGTFFNLTWLQNNKKNE